MFECVSTVCVCVPCGLIHLLSPAKETIIVQFIVAQMLFITSIAASVCVSPDKKQQ